VARHRRPVNVRDDGLLAVLGPLVTVAGVERAVLLDVDSGMVLDAWVCGEAPVGSAPGSGAGSASDGGPVGQPGPGTASSGGSAGNGDTAPGGGAWPGVGALWRSLRGVFDRPPDPAVDGGGTSTGTGGGGDGLDRGDGRVGGASGGLTGGGSGEEAVSGDVEAFGARHADLVRALLALPGSPPGELTLVVDDRHHLVRCVADPAGGRLALAVVVAGTPWAVRRVRRHLRQLPDAGLTTGPWLLTWAVGPPPAPRPPADRPPTGHGGPSPDSALGGAGLLSRVGADDWVPPPADPVRSRVVLDGWPPSPAESHTADGLPLPEPPGGRAPVGAEPHALPDGRSPAADVDGLPVALASPDDASALVTDPAATVPDPRRGPAPPSALPPARSAGGW
jgi:hypothetical protein